MVQGHVLRLRRALGDTPGAPSLLQTRGDGYRLAVECDQLDAARFESLLAEGRTADALALWRGPAYAELTGLHAAHAEAQRLEELRLVGEEQQIDDRIARGEQSAAVGELRSLIEAHPLRERLRAQLMLALYRDGRQVEALAVFRDTRRLFAEEYGIEPGAQLRDLELRILRQDPELAPVRAARAPVASPPAGPRRTMLAGTVLAALALTVVAIGFATGGHRRDRGPPALVPARSIGVLGASGRRLGDARLAGTPDLLALGRVDGRTRLVAASTGSRTLVSVSLDGRVAAAPVALGVQPGGLALGAGVAWVADASSSTLLRVDPRFGTVDRVAVPGAGPIGALAVGAGSLWAADYGLFTGPDPQRRDRPDRSAERPRRAPHRALAARRARLRGGGPVGRARRRRPAALAGLDRVDGSVRVAGDAWSLAVGGGYVWARTDGTLWQLDPSDLRIVRGFPVPAGRGDIAWAAGAVWVAAPAASSVIRLDPTTGAATRHAVGGAVDALAATGLGASARVFVAVGARPRAVAPGAPVLDLPGSPTLDPAFAFDPDSWRLAHATCATLLTYANGSGRLVPDAAAAPPAVSRDGRTYRFRIRAGMRFSPPSGQPVTARTFADTIQRALSPALGPNAILAQAGFLDDISGLPAFRSGRADAIAGLRARGDVLTIRLRRPAGDLPARLAMPIFCAVPSGTPATRGGITVPIPSAGPYYATAVGSSELLLRRNPGYAGSRPRPLAAVVLRTDLDPDAAATDVLHGRADLAESGSVRRLPALFAPRGPLASGSALTRDGARALSLPRVATQFLELNTRRGPFRDVRMRAALSAAIDRRALAAAIGARPTDAYLPAGADGGPTGGAFGLRADLRRARALAVHGGRAIVLTRELSSCPLCAADARLLSSELARIGIRVVVRQVPEPAVTALAPHSRWDIAFDNWIFDYPDAADLMPLVDGRHAGDRTSQDVSGLHDPRVDAALDRAAAERGPARTAAYRRIVRRLERHDIPFAVYANQSDAMVVGGRLGCLRASPELGLDLASLCVKRTG